MSHPTLYLPSQVSEEVNQELSHSGKSVLLRWDQRLPMEERVGSIHSLCSGPMSPSLFLKPATHHGWFKNTQALGVLDQFPFMSLKDQIPLFPS